MEIACLDCNFVDEKAKTSFALLRESVSLRVEKCLERGVNVASLRNTAPLRNCAQCNTDLVITG
jgi:hypothetical protein